MQRVRSPGLISGVTTYTLDAEGNTVRIDNPSNSGGVTRQTFVLDSQGHSLRQIQTGADGIPQTQNYFYANGSPIGSIGGIDASTFDDNYTPISDSYPPANPGSYIASGGESLSAVAQAEYGDASLWYLIADANGLSLGDSLSTGQVLSIPNPVTNLHNTSTTYKPYDPTRILGDNTPQLTAPPPPKDHSSQFANIIGIGIVVAVVVTVLLSFVATPVVGAAVGAAAGSSAQQVTLAVANHRYHYSSLLDVFTGRANSVLAVFDPSIAGVPDYDYKATAIAAAAGAAGGYVGGEVAGGVNSSLAASAGTTALGAAAPSTLAGAVAGGLAGGVAGNVTSQTLNLLADRQKGFDFGSLVGSAIGGGLSGALSFGFHGSGDFRFGGSPPAGSGLLSSGNFFTDVAAETVLRFGAGVAAQSVQIAIDNKGKLDLVSIAVDSFGNALGNSIVSAIKSTQPKQKSNDQKWDDLKQHADKLGLTPADIDSQRTNGSLTPDEFVKALIGTGTQASITGYRVGVANSDGTISAGIVSSNDVSASNVSAKAITLLDGSALDPMYANADLDIVSPAGTKVEDLPRMPAGYGLAGLYLDQDGDIHLSYKKLSDATSDGAGLAEPKVNADKPPLEIIGTGADTDLAAANVQIEQVLPLSVASPNETAKAIAEIASKLELTTDLSVIATTAAGKVAALNVLNRAANLQGPRMLSIAKASELEQSVQMVSETSRSGIELAKYLKFVKGIGGIGLAATGVETVADVIAAPEDQRYPTVAADVANIAGQSLTVLGGFETGAGAGAFFGSFFPTIAPFTIAIGGAAGAGLALVGYDNFASEPLKESVLSLIEKAKNLPDELKYLLMNNAYSNQK